MFATVLVTTPDLASAENIAERLIELRLVACANYWPIRSMYRWKGKVERSGEYALTLKIWSADFSTIVEAVRKIHPYDNPCIVRYEISAGSQPYLEWIKESTERPAEDFARR